MLPEFQTEPRELPRQPKLSKNKPKFRRFQFSKSYADNVCVYGRVFGVGEFKYTNENFRGAKGVAIATKFTQKGQKSQISVLYAIQCQFLHLKIFGVVEFKYAI